MADGQQGARFGSHSLRIGGATALYQSTKDLEQVKRFGRWTSDAFHGYLWESHERQRGLATRMAQADGQLLAPRKDELGVKVGQERIPPEETKQHLSFRDHQPNLPKAYPADQQSTQQLMPRAPTATVQEVRPTRKTLGRPTKPKAILASDPFPPFGITRCPQPATADTTLTTATEGQRELEKEWRKGVLPQTGPLCHTKTRFRDGS